MWVQQMTLDTQTVMLFTILLSVLGSAWKLFNGLSDLRERMARLEGRMDTLESVIVQVFTQREPAQ